MASGTYGFRGERLKEAREARGMTAASLAEQLSITRSAVSQFETNRTSPSPEIMHKISGVLNLPQRFFVREPFRPGKKHFFFRCLSSATKAARARIKRKHEWLQDLVGFLSHYVEFPRENLPDLDLPSNPLDLTENDIENAAAELRRYWGLGQAPISNVVWLLENNGVIVTRMVLGEQIEGSSEARTIKGDGGLDALSIWAENVPYIILGADKASAARSRFDAAHELGHLILHRKACEWVSEGSDDLEKKNRFRTQEEQAHRFSGAFLLPKEQFKSEFYVASLDALRTLKERWRTSIGMMIKRAGDLALIDIDEQKRLWVNLSRRGWRTHEPLDDKLVLEQPRLLRGAILLLLEQGILSKAVVREAVPFASDDIETLCNLGSGFLNDNPPEVKIIPFENLY